MFARAKCLFGEREVEMVRGANVDDVDILSRDELLGRVSHTGSTHNLSAAAGGFSRVSAHPGQRGSCRVDGAGVDAAHETGPDDAGTE